MSKPRKRWRREYERVVREKDSLYERYQRDIREAADDHTLLMKQISKLEADLLVTERERDNITIQHDGLLMSLGKLYIKKMERES